MARSNGPFGPPGTRAPQGRQPAGDPYATPAPAHDGQWHPPEYPDPAQVHPPQPGQGYHFPPPEPDPNYAYHQQPQSQQQWAPQPDPRGYDLGNYMPSAAQPYPPGEPGHFQQGPYSAQFAPPNQGYAEADAGYADDFIEDDEPRRGRRWLFVAAALVGAIGLGGALAYTYKSVIAPSPGRVPLVKAGDTNVKVRPDSRGDRKMLSRLNDDAGRQKPAAEAEAQDDRPGDEGGPRKVKTIPIVPGGSPPAAEAIPPPSLPGIMLDNVQRTPHAHPAPQQPPPGRVVIGRPPPPPPAAGSEEASPPPAAKKPPVHVVPPVAAKPPPPPAKPRETPVAAPSTGAGYVAVLSSQKSRMDALKVFADLQQKHSEVLAGKTPDVQEADLSARGLGTMYRLVVGPPGSREAALGVCSQLRTAGQDCWVKEY